MSAVGMLARHEIKRRWISTVGLTLLIGIVGAIVLSAVAGSRRTSTAFTRFVTTSDAATVEVLPPFAYIPTAAEINAVRHVRNVESVAELRAYAVFVRGTPLTFGVASQMDNELGTTIDRQRLLTGRLPNQNAYDEVAIPESLARLLHKGVGAHLTLLSYAPAQMKPGPPPKPLGPTVQLNVVGVTRRPFDLGDLAAQGGNMPLTRAFDQKFVNKIGNFGVVLRMKTKHGDADAAAVTAAVQKIFKADGPISSSSTASETQGAQNAIDVLVIALRVFAAVFALAGIVTIGIVLTRDISLASVDYPTLRTMGITRRGRTSLNMPRIAIVAVAGGVLAVIGAVALSPLLPFGLAGRADPDRGVHFDSSVLLLGGGALIVIVLAIGYFASLRAARRSVSDDAGRESSTIAYATARLGPVPAAGLRMALTPGGGRTAVPVRSACFGAIAGVLGIVAVLVFGASLNALVTTPRDYGWTWDYKVRDAKFSPQQSKCDANSLGVAQRPGVGAVAAVCDNDILLGRHPTTAWGITPIRGSIKPEVIAGRAPRTADEVALGAKTMRFVNVHIGGTVTARTSTKASASYHVVGQIVLPTLGYPQALADGAIMTGAGLQRIFDTNARASRYILVRDAPGAKHAAKSSTVPVEIARVRDVNWIPRTLAVLLGLLALIAIGHAVVTAVRRRRRDLAMLKTLGFRRGDICRSVAWQSSILGAIGVAFGIPLGIVVGRLAWRAVANGLGVSYSTTTTIPWAALAIGIPIGLLLVNLLALLPARAAARINTATALRAE